MASRNKFLRECLFFSIVLWSLLRLSEGTYGWDMRGFKMVDLGHAFDNRTISWVGLRQFELDIQCMMPTTVDPCIQVEDIVTSTHAGTHFETKTHVGGPGRNVSDIPLHELMFLPTVVVDISKDVGNNPHVHLEVHHLERFEKKYGRIPDKSFLIVRTGWSRFYPDKLKYIGTDNEDRWKIAYPAITMEAAQWIIKNRNVYGVGIDSISINARKTPFVVHRIILENEKWAVENMKDLHKLPPTGALSVLMPMKLRWSGGASCRVVALVRRHNRDADCDEDDEDCDEDDDDEEDCEDVDDHDDGEEDWSWINRLGEGTPYG